MRKINLIWLGLVMMLMFSGSVLAEVCSSTSMLLEGESRTYRACGERGQAISKNDIFFLGDVEWQYKGADKVTEESPRIKFKNLETGDTVEYSIEVANGVATFTLRFMGESYLFKSISDIYSNDYDIRLVSGGVRSCGDYEVRPIFVGLNHRVEEVREARLEVNGEKTSKLMEGESYDLADGTRLTITEIIYQAYAGGIHAVRFCLDGEAQEIPEEAEEVEEVIETEPVNLAFDLTNYPELFIQREKFNGYFVVGWYAPPIDNLAMTDIAVGIQEEGYVVADAAKLDSELSDPFVANLIVVGRPEENKVTRMITGTSRASNFLEPGEGLLKLYSNKGFVQLLVVGYSPEDTRKAAKVLKNYQDYNLQGTEIIIRGAKDNPQIEILAEPLEIPLEEEEEEVEEGVPPEEPPLEEEEEEVAITPEVEIPEEACEGCQANSNCLPYGTRLIQKERAKFCDITKNLAKQKELGAACQNNYECLSNQCGDGKCISLYEEVKKTRGILESIWEWIKRFFGG